MARTAVVVLSCICSKAIYTIYTLDRIVCLCVNVHFNVLCGFLRFLRHNRESWITHHTCHTSFFRGIRAGWSTQTYCPSSSPLGLERRVKPATMAGPAAIVPLRQKESRWCRGSWRNKEDWWDLSVGPVTNGNLVLINRMVGVGEGVRRGNRPEGGGWLLMQQGRLGSGRGGMMDTADRPVRKFQGKGEGAPSSGR